VTSALGFIRWTWSLDLAAGLGAADMRTHFWGPDLPEAHVFDAIKSFVTELTSGDKHPRTFDDNDYRIAFAALLVHAAAIDGRVSGTERDKLNALLKQRFALDDEAAGELVEQATAAEQEAIDLYGFTHQLMRTLDESERCRMVEMMWEIAFADGAISEFEDNLIWRAADLLGVSSRERIALRLRVSAASGPAEG
jgi:uncharacterized tellurite resistance protein B-like protein